MQEITAEYAINSQQEAQWAYNKAIEQFYYSMLEVVFLRIKSHLSHQGLKKVKEIDERRKNDEDLGVEFSENTWKALSESWTGAEGLAMRKIADLYGLVIDDLDIAKISKNNEINNTPKCNKL